VYEPAPIPLWLPDVPVDPVHGAEQDVALLELQVRVAL
jgi:hypothetical protein